jgi:hypothetical protein
MSTTGTAVHDTLAVKGKTNADTLLALKAAISASWPQIRMNEYAATIATLATETYTYSLSALTLLDSELGISRLYIKREDDEPEVLTRGWRQYFDQSAGAWTLVIEPSLVEAYVGKVVNGQYQYRHPTISALTDTVYLPADYLAAYCEFWYAKNRMWENLTDKGQLTNLLVLGREEWQRILRANQTPALHLLPMAGYDRMRT